MTATLSIVRGSAAEDVACESEQLRNAAAEVPKKAWDAQQFAQEQIRGLVRRVFLQGWPRPSRQVVFSSAGSQVEVAAVCRKAGEVLAAERAGRVALVEADVRTKALELSFGRTSNDGENSTENDTPATAWRGDMLQKTGGNLVGTQLAEPCRAA